MGHATRSSYFHMFSVHAFACFQSIHFHVFSACICALSTTADRSMLHELFACKYSWVFDVCTRIVYFQVAKKLAGHATGTAAWATNVGNKHGQALTSVLTAAEGAGLTEMAAGISQLVCPKKSPGRALVSRQPDKSPTDDDIADMELFAAPFSGYFAGTRLPMLFCRYTCYFEGYTCFNRVLSLLREREVWVTALPRSTRILSSG